VVARWVSAQVRAAGRGLFGGWLCSPLEASLTSASAIRSGARSGVCSMRDWTRPVIAAMPPGYPTRRRRFAALYRGTFWL
jgi:hypothetical protein